MINIIDYQLLINTSYINNIKKILAKYNGSYITIDNEFSIKKVHSLLVNNNIYKPSNDTEMIYLGLYYGEIEKDYDLMKKYYKQK